MRKAPKNESKRERFKRLAALRTNEVLLRLKILGNCSNKSAYEYVEDDLNKIFSAIEKRTQAVRAKFDIPSTKEEFKL